MFYRCLVCGNIIYVVDGDINRVRCCGKELVELEAGSVDASLEKHVPVYEVKGNKMVVRVGEVEHPMESDHYIMWIAMVRDGKVSINYLNPGDKPEAVFCYKKDITLYAYCNKHGLWKCEVK